jgi:L-threonylcarbamoyladenylate synthase
LNTQIYELDENNIDMDIIKKAAETIRKNGTVIFPTETVYGLGANALSAEAAKAIFKAKGRPSDNPLIVHISSIDMLLYVIGEKLSDKAKLLMDKFWPGPLTLIFKKSSVIPMEVTAGLNTVAVRMPDNQIALELIKQSSLPIAAPSANISGKPSPTI